MCVLWCVCVCACAAWWLCECVCGVVRERLCFVFCGVYVCESVCECGLCVCV